TLAAATGNSVTVWSASQQSKIGTLTTPAPVNTVAYQTTTGPGGPSVIAAGSTDYNVYLWDWTASARQPDRTMISSRQFGPINAVALSPDGSLLAAASDDGTVLLARISIANNRVDATYLGQLSGHIGPVEALAFSPNGRTLASGGRDDGVLLWDV